MRTFDPRQILGIIGGSGVAAGAEIVSRLERRLSLEGAFRDHHHPQVILFQATQAPSRSLFLEGRGESFLPAYTAVGKALAGAGATLLCMTCNTAHWHRGELEQAIGLPWVDALDETCRVFAERHPHVRRVGVLCSEGSRAVRLFETYFQRNLSVVPLFPSAEGQKAVTEAICSVKKGQHHLPDSADAHPGKLLVPVIQELLQQQVEAIVLGCCEISLALTPPMISHLGVPIVDTMDALVDACLERMALPSGGA
jgi:aspartate racemase